MTTYRCTIIHNADSAPETSTIDAISPQQAALFLASNLDLPTGAIVRVDTVNGERRFEITAQPSVTYSARDRTNYGHSEDASEVLV